MNLKNAIFTVLIFAIASAIGYSLMDKANDNIKDIGVKIEHQGDRALTLNTECVEEVKACSASLLRMYQDEQRAERLLEACSIQLDTAVRSNKDLTNHIEKLESSDNDLSVSH